MKTITIRGIEPDLAEKLKQVAGQNGKSVNQLLIDTIEQSFGMKKKKKFTLVHDDMDHLFGRWSDEEFKRIQGRIDACRKIDEESAIANNDILRAQEMPKLADDPQGMDGDRFRSHPLLILGYAFRLCFPQEIQPIGVRAFPSIDGGEVR